MSSRIRCAYLRVYQPLDAFPVPERDRLERALRAGVKPRRSPHALGLVDPSERKEIYAKEVDGCVFVCPAQTRLRTLLGLVAFERTLPQGASEVFFTTEEVRAARRELERLEATPTRLRPFLAQSAWHVPVRWFACFDETERRLRQEGDHPTIVYETTVGSAHARIARALEALKGGTVHPVIVGMVYELNEWLQTFDQRAVLELDYASVAGLFTEDDLADDHSAADVQQAIEALAAGDGLRAGLYYQRVNERWGPCRARESLN